jgi:hypothetical protein
LDAAGVAGPSRMDGVSLVPLIRGESPDVPSEAWSYSASNNRGIALRLDNRVKYILTNAAWSQISGEDELFDLEADPQETADLSATDPRSPELRSRVIDGVLQQHEGYRLTIRNRGARQLRGWLGGSLAHHARLKTADPDCDCIHWKPGARPKIRLKPGQQVRLQLESPSTPRMSFALWSFGDDGGRQRQTWRFGPADLVDPVAWSLTDTGWRQVEDPAAVPEIGFRLWREGDRTPASGSEPKADEQMMEQLRALGYVQ